MLLSVAMISYPDIDPVLLQIGPVAIRWYALAYIVGVLLGYRYIKTLNAQHHPPIIPAKPFEDLITWAILGIMLGGRLGYVLFYNAGYYLQYPQEILAIWKGGMSFHGGLLGVIIGFYGYARRYRLPYVRLMDMVACAAPIGLFFGRIANFINGELFGRVTTVPWGMVFPHGGLLPRHPSQLYEAALEGLVLFAVLFICSRSARIRDREGALSGLFLLGYSLARGAVEQFREPDHHLGYVWGTMTMGQLLSVPMLLAGVFLVVRAMRRGNGARAAD